MLLDTTAQVSRKIFDGVEYNETVVYAKIQCAIVPISEFDQLIAYARESTHVLFVPDWLGLRKEDLISTGRMAPDAQGDVQPYTFSVNGKNRLRLGMARSTYFVRQLD